MGYKGVIGTGVIGTGLIGLACGGMGYHLAGFIGWIYGLSFAIGLILWRYD